MTTRIAIDANEANVPNRVGSNVYAFQLLRAIEEETRSRDDVEVTVLLAAPPLSDFPQERPGWKYQVFGPIALWTQWALPQHLFWHRQDYDVVFTPGHYAPRFSPIPYVSSVMDLAFLYFPEQFRWRDRVQLTEWTRYSVAGARKIITISEHSKDDVVRAYHRQPEDVVVAYPGVTTHIETIKEKDRANTLKKWKIRHPYLLCVGTLQPRKNIVRLIEAFETVIQNSGNLPTRATYIRSKSSLQSELQLVLAGKVGWLAKDITARIAKSPLRDRIIVTGFVSEGEKAVLYQESVASILVGLYEGYGMPAIEALQHGSLPIISETTSLPEVVGGAGIFVDPHSVASIAEGIQTALTLPAKQRAQYLRLGRQQIKLRNWQRSAEVVLATLLDVAHQHQ